MKQFLLITCPFLLFSCSGSEPEQENEPSPASPPEVVSEDELEEEPPKEDPLKLADPKTTETLLQEEDKKTVSGPVPLDVPEPPIDSSIEIKPSPVTGE